MERYRWTLASAVLIRALIVVCANAEAAATWTYLDSNSARADFVPAGLLADANGVWIRGAANGHAAVVRYANDLQPAFLRYADVSASFAASLPDGGFLTLDPTTSGDYRPLCTVARFNASGAQVWSQTTYSGCALYGTDASGGFWLGSDDALLRFAADGAATEIAESPHANAGAVNPRDTSVYLAIPAATPTNGSSSALARVTSYDRQGSVKALWQAPDASVQIAFLRVGDDDNVYAIGSSAGGMFSLGLTAAGTIRYLKILTSVSANLVAFTASADGGIAALDQAGYVYAIDHGGNLRFAVSAGSNARCLAPATLFFCSVQTAANGDLLALTRDDRAHLVRIDANGHVLSSVPVTTAFVDSIVTLADDSALTAGISAADFRRFDREATPLAVPPVNALAPVDAAYVASAQAPDGTLYIASANAQLQTLWLSKISAHGRLVWKQALSGYLPGATLKLNQDRLCLSVAAADASQNSHIECRANDSGALLWEYAVDYPTLALLDSGEVVIFDAGYGSGNSRQIVLDANGNVEHATDLGHAFAVLPEQIAIAANGTLVVSDLHEYDGIFAWDKDGHLLYRRYHPIAGDSRLDGQVVADADGSILTLPILGATGSFQEYLWAINADGTTRWIQLTSGNPQIVIAQVGGGNAQLLQSQFPDVPLLRTISLADGAPLSSVPLQSDDPYPGIELPRLDSTTGLALFSSWQPLAIVDPATGKLIRRIAKTCVAAICDQGYSAAFSTDGTLRIVRGELDAGAGQRARIDAYAAANTPMANIRVDQQGIAGAWYPAYAGGQGFTFDYIAGANTIFMPWFTYSQEAVVGPSGLAWYGLQGAVAPGATSVDLDIATTDPGSFNNGSVGGHVVGHANLTFADCDSGWLKYKFDDVGYITGLQGLIALTRLSPSTAACTLADGSSVPAQNTNAPANGFDARQSGSWFDPTTGGQGVEMTIVPAGSGSAGIVFVAWFTFDPAGQGDDELNQHWFTLQGDLSAASNGKVTLPIYRIVGGALDYGATSDFAEVGQATLTMLACDSAQLDYRFDTTELAHAFSGLAGSSHLIKIGGCSAP
jgi:hypothetical protein